MVRISSEKFQKWIESNPRKLFGLLILFLVWLSGFFKALEFGPHEPHMWRQADCLAIAYHYYAFDFNLFNPSVLWTGMYRTGKVVSEIPVLYWLVAGMWKVFGQHEFIFRLISMSLLVVGLFHLHKTGMYLFRSSFWANVVVAILFSSVAVVFYAGGFLPNTSALGLALVGIYFLVRYFHENSSKLLLVSTLFFVLAGLLKVTALLSWVALAGGYGLVLLFNKDFKKLLSFAAPQLGLIAIMLIWVKITNDYNHKNGTLFLFLQDIWPYWEAAPEERSQIVDQFLRHVFPFTFDKSIWISYVLILGYLLYRWKQIPGYYTLALIALPIGVGLFSVLWFAVLNVHDYYTINLLVIVPITWLLFLYLLSKFHPRILNNQWIRVAVVCWLSVVWIKTASYNRLRYESDDWIATHVWSDEEYKNLYGWINWDFIENKKAVTHLNKALDEMGVEKTDKVFCMPDHTINWSLYCAGRTGFTDYGYLKEDGSRKLDLAINRGAKYLVVMDPKELDKPSLTPYLGDPIGEYEYIKVFRIGN